MTVCRTAHGISLLLCGLVVLGAGASPDSRSPEPGEGFPGPETHPVTATLIAAHQSIRPGGTTQIGVRFELMEQWHIYAQDPGDAGLPTTLTWEGPASVTFSPLRWPRHEQFLDPGDIQTFGYKEEVLLSSSLTLDPNAALDTALPIRAAVTWLACKEICIPGSATLDLALPVSEADPAPSLHADLFEQAG